MRTLKIGLRDGFKQDEVTISVNGKIVARESNATSNPAISLAKEFHINLPDDSGDVSIDVPSRKISASAHVDPGTVYLAAFLQGGKLELRPLMEDLPAM